MDQLPRLGKRELICLLLFTCNYVVFVWRGFLFLWVLGMGFVILLWHSLSLPYNYFVYFVLYKATISGERLQDYWSSGLRTGIDYLGPLYIKSNGENKKTWICLFICLVTRAIHLELMKDMTAEEFLCGFLRFISIRGTPAEITSDNALHFKTASKVLDLVWKDVIRCEEVQDYVSNSRIKWSFIVELAPWMGGFYERLVGLVKELYASHLEEI